MMAPAKKPVDPYAEFQQPVQQSGKDPYADFQEPAQVQQPATPQGGFFSSAADSSGLSGLAHAVAHPIDTAMGIPAAIKGAVGNTVDNVKQGVADYKATGLSTQTRRDFGRAVPIVGPALAKSQDQYDAGNKAGAAGTMAGLVGGLAAPSVFKAAVPVAGRAIATAGKAGQDAGIGLINKTIGTLKSDFKHGANPGAGYFAGGGGPALSMGGLADKADAIVGKTGKQLSAAYKSSKAVIPANDVFDAAAKPVSELRKLQSGFGGTGVAANVEAYEDNLLPTLQAGYQRGGFTPSELFEQAKRPLAKNTRWNDPTMFDLNTVRQQTTGAIGGLLTDAVPETKQLNSIYQGAGKFADTAASRAETGSRPLSTLVHKSTMSGIGAVTGGATGGTHGALLGTAAGLAMDSVPVKSTIASGLYYGGKGAEKAGNWLMPPSRTSMIPVTPYNVVAGKGYKKQK